MIALIDYGISNLRSVQKAFEHLGAPVTLTREPDQVMGADKLILPGVGAFSAGMDGLRQRLLIEPIKRQVQAGVPLIGICLGMQLLFGESEEVAQGAQPEPSASAPSADEDLLKKVPLPTASERLKEEVALVQPVQSGPSKFKETLDTTPPVKKKEIDTARKETSRATSDASMAMQTRPSPGSPSAKGGFTLNVASFKEKEKAERYKDELRRQRIEAFDWAIYIPRLGTWYRVSVGNFSTREHAELFARKLEQRLKIKGIISQAP
jgi:cell division septation protein DedD